ncbi:MULTISPECIES: TraR/DksA family transcriptional regulator [unclassified Streptomyces]|uniref:TraR/DksA family transcriptional regulator n=1 Tax=unclassified Streptomyces TaxID=2593676 RepID=UPI0016611989|nr:MULTISPECIES: TraR/DksA C4-type zinc finger protein [unclassified Streptomyces]MBD0708515.1 DNA-binding protein [Streptomyces sp. CBMA291]MBD0717165.1 DNA-binding protein [Streptomyces sp. CBMA370]
MVAKKTATRHSPAGETAAGTDAARTPDADKAPAKKAPAEAPAKKAAAGKAPAKKAPAEAPAKKAAARKTAARKTPARKTAAGETAAKEAPAKRAAAGKTPAKKTAPGARKQTGARTVAAQRTAPGETAGVPAAGSWELAVRPGEEPWTPAEVAEARTGLQAEVLRLRSELAHSREELTGLMRDSGDGAGDDQADTGTKNITREHELSLAANAREMLEQTEHALERLDAGTYGLCEVCGKPIGKARMQAFPRATLCVEDKQRQERRG